MFDTVTQEVSDGAAEAPTTFNSVNFVVWPLQAIAAFPLRNDAGAPIIYVVVVALVLAMLVAAWRRDSTRLRIVTLASLAVTLAFPFVFTLTTLDTIGNIWQGRYVLPYGVGFLLLAGYALGRGRPSSGPKARLVVTVATFYALAVVACLIKVRNNELEGNAASFRDAAWHAPSPVLLIALVGIACASFVLALSARAQAHSGTPSHATPDQLRATDA